MKNTLTQFLSQAICSLRRRIFQQEQKDIGFYLQHRAAEETAEYVENKMLSLPYFDNSFQLLDFTWSKVKKEGLYLEIESGWQGKSIKLMVKRIQETVPIWELGQSLPLAQIDNINDKNSSSNHQNPKGEDNLELSFFYKHIQEFAATHEEKIAFAHLKCSDYFSSKKIFELLDNRICPGTIIQFDKYFYYPGWKQQQFKAFQEFMRDRKLSYEYLGYCSYGYAVSAIIF